MKKTDSKTIKVNKANVMCNGAILENQDPVSEGHPKIYLHIKEKGQSINCPYCENVFLYK